MNFIDSIKLKAKENKKTIVLPEIEERIIKAGIIASEENIANIIFLGSKEEIQKILDKNDLKLNENIKIIEYLSEEYKEEYNKKALKFAEIRKSKNMKFEEAKEILKDPVYFGMMLLDMNECDGLVAGAKYATKDILRPSLQIIKTKEGSSIVSSYFLIDTNIKEYGEDGIIFMADCGLNINPDESELSNIALDSAHTFRTLLGKDPRLAFLSFSTFKSAESDSTKKVREAVRLTKEKADFLLDGEMQLDTALIREVANKKAKDSKVAGRANILIFPDLDSGNIGYKMAQYMSKGKAYGPLLQGIKKPVNDLSRGANVSEIIGVIAITALEAQK